MQIATPRRFDCIRTSRTSALILGFALAAVSSALAEAGDVGATSIIDHSSLSQCELVNYCDSCADPCCCDAVDGGCCTSVSDCCGCCPIWYGSAELLFLRRNNGSQDQILVFNGATNETLISTGNFNFDTEPGARFTIGRAVGDFAVEATYFGLQEWGEAITAVGDNNLRIPGDIALATLDFLDADIMRVDYESRIHNVEVNGVKTFDRFALLGGLRYFNLDERFNLNSEDFDSGISDYTIDASNNLFGAQMGLRYQSQGELAFVRITTKAGVYDNDTRQNTDLADFDNTFVLRDADVNGADVAFIGEINVDTIVPLNNCFSLKAGYNLLWVEGVALAMDQLDFTDTPTSGFGLDQSAGVFFYGANIGLEGRW